MRLSIDDETLLRLRWRALLLDGHDDPDVTDVVAWFGALQAQDLRHGQWAIGVRSGRLTRADVEVAHREGRILRTWVMRGTLHHVPAADAAWMVEHLGRRMRPAVVTRLRNVGVDEADAARAVDALVTALAGGAQPRSACRTAVRGVLGDATTEQISRVIDLAALDAGVLPDATDGGEQRYTLLVNAAPVSQRLDRPEAHVTIARRYVRGHGPVSPHDLARWAGMTVTDARRAIAELGDELTTVTWNDTVLHLTRELADRGPSDDESVCLLPAYDEHVIGYASRQPTVPLPHDGRIVPGGNGIYQPTVGRAAGTLGTWKQARSGAPDVAWFGPTAPLEDAMATWRRFDGPAPTG